MKPSAPSKIATFVTEVKIDVLLNKTSAYVFTNSDYLQPLYLFFTRVKIEWS